VKGLDEWRSRRYNRFFWETRGRSFIRFYSDHLSIRLITLTGVSESAGTPGARCSALHGEARKGSDLSAHG